MSKPAAKPREPLPPEVRQRALGQGTAGVLGAVAGLLGGSWMLEAMGSTGRAPLLLVFFLCLAAVVFGVWRLGAARDGRWDGRGLLALAVMILGYPLLFFFAGWFAIGMYVLITGQPLRLFGE